VIYGIGIDMVDVARIERLWQRYGQRFAEHILTPAELKSLSSSRRPERFLAKAFAVKEAVAKAIGTGFSEGVYAATIGTQPDELGKPNIEITPQLQAVFNKRGIIGGHISISDEAGLVIAQAVLETE